MTPREPRQNKNETTTTPDATAPLFSKLNPPSKRNVCLLVRKNTLAGKDRGAAASSNSTPTVTKRRCTRLVNAFSMQVLPHQPNARHPSLVCRTRPQRETGEQLLNASLVHESIPRGCTQSHAKAEFLYRINGLCTSDTLPAAGTPFFQPLTAKSLSSPQLTTDTPGRGCRRGRRRKTSKTCVRLRQACHPCAQATAAPRPTSAALAPHPPPPPPPPTAWPSS